MKTYRPLGFLIYAIFALAWLTGIIVDFANGDWLWAIVGICVFPIGIISGVIHWLTWLS